jgi:pilus assembly protein CpaB
MRVSTLNRMLGAGLCAAAATYLTVSWIGAPAPAARTVTVAKEVQVQPDVRMVLVAAQPLRFGTTITAEVLTEVPWPAVSVPVGSFTSRDSLLHAGGPRTVVSAIAKGEPILASKITGPGQRGSLSFVIDEGKKAVTIRVDDVLGVAGFVQPDDRVDILLTRIERQATSVGKAVVEKAYTDLLLQNVRVLAIDQIADRSPQAKPAKAVTVEVFTEDAQKLVLGASVGQLSLALRNAGSSYMADGRRIGLENLPRGEAAEAPADAPLPEHGVIVTVTRGTMERSQYELTPYGRREISKTQTIGIAGAQGDPRSSAGPQLLAPQTE